MCLDHPLQVTGSRTIGDCLILSFGVNFEISFDIAMRDANCEVLMFDKDEYSHPIAEEDDYVNFHQVSFLL